MPLRQILFCTFLPVLVIGTAHAAASPSAIVRTASDQVLAILKDDKLSRTQRWQQVSDILHANFDFEGISRSVLATKWHEAKVEEQREFVRYFSQYLEAVYRTRFENYTGQQVRIDNENLQGDRAVVDTTIVSSDVEIPVNYRMRRKEDRWLVYDVLIEGQSMVNSYRNTFKAIAQTGGMQGLLDDVKRRIEKHRKARESTAE